MTRLQLKDVHALANKLFWEIDSAGEIFPPAEECKDNENCWLFIRELHHTTHTRIEKILSHIILDFKKPCMTIEEQFFVRERLRFAMFLSECIDPKCEGTDDPPASSKDVKINIEGTTTEHFLFWLVDFVFWCLGEVELQCKAYEQARRSRELGLTNCNWTIVREDPHHVEEKD